MKIAGRAGKTAKWIGFNEVGGPESVDPSYVDIGEPQAYIDYIKEREQEERRKLV